MRTVEVKVFSFEELNDKAKDKAREWFRNTETLDTIDLQGLFEEALLEAGLPSEDIRYRLSYCQGDGVAFYGRLDLEKFLSHYNLTDQFQTLLDTGVRAYLCKQNSFYDHWNSMSVEVEDCGPLSEDEMNLLSELVDVIRENIRDMSRSLERIGYEEIEGALSDESIDELIRVNEIEFLGNGKPCRF